MGVYIKDFKMPKDCPMCPLAHYNKLDEFTGCGVVHGKMYAVKRDKQYANSTTRPQWCPLLEVSECGRLIDADAFYKELSTVDDDTAVTVAEIKNLVLFFETAIPREDGKFCGTLYRLHKA